MGSESIQLCGHLNVTGTIDLYTFVVHLLHMDFAHTEYEATAVSGKY